MKDVWSQQPPSEKPNRNTFDLSFRNNLSMKIGKIYPVMCKEVIPGDTFHIDAQFGLSFMPMYFPIQTPLRAHLSFYYVRNRNLWKNWKKFLRNKGQINPATDFPYISGSTDHLNKLFKIGGLADYLGCPTNVTSTFSNVSITSYPVAPAATQSVDGEYSAIKDFSRIILDPNYASKNHGLWFYRTHFSNFSNDLCLMSDFQRVNSTYRCGNHKIEVVFNYVGSNPPQDTTIQCYPVLFRAPDVSYDAEAVLINNPGQNHELSVDMWNNFAKNLRLVGISANPYQLDYDSTKHQFIPPTSLDSVSMIADKSSGFSSYSELFDAHNDGNLFYGFIFFQADGTIIKSNSFLEISSYTISGFGYSVYSSDTNAYSSGDLKISALPFRAYESVYNALIRSTQNDPFMINGVEEYDKFITNDGDGADSTDYHIFDAYWENDHLTESFQSPQQGDAPLLGLSGNTTPPTSFSASYLLRYTTEDGSQNNIRVRKNNNKLEFDTTNQNNLSKELQGDLDALNNATQFGISINDLRNVNSLQRWLENAIMNGYRYKDIIRGHFGIDISLKELEMPEFLGGKSEFVNISPVEQSVEGSLPLGWKAGQAGLFTGMQNGIDKYCDEHGFIIATLTVIPVPVYQQLLPKFFTKFGVLDYYSPEFKNIGMQPQKYREVCPLETLNAGDSLEGVFSYQRPWYDYLGSVDEAHGQFRDTLSGYLMTRIFKGKPVLGSDFLKIDHETTDNVFVVTAGEDDKIFGQVQFIIRAERPIPLFNRPRLE